MFGLRVQSLAKPVVAVEVMSLYSKKSVSIPHLSDDHDCHRRRRCCCCFRESFDGLRVAVFDAFSISSCRRRFLAIVFSWQSSDPPRGDHIVGLET